MRLLSNSQNLQTPFYLSIGSCPGTLLTWLRTHHTDHCYAHGTMPVYIVLVWWILTYVMIIFKLNLEPFSITRFIQNVACKLFGFMSRRLEQFRHKLKNIIILWKTFLFIWNRVWLVTGNCLWWQWCQQK